MEEINHRKAFVLGENIREDLDEITRSERRIMEGHIEYAGRPISGLSRFVDLQQRNQNFQMFYNYPAAGNIKFRVQM